MAQTMATTKCMRERVMAMAITTRDYEREDSVRTWAAERGGGNKKRQDMGSGEENARGNV